MTEIDRILAAADADLLAALTDALDTEAGLTAIEEAASKEGRFASSIVMGAGGGGVSGMVQVDRDDESQVATPILGLVGNETTV
ncbi:MAG TPA: hypothetical protein VM677_20245 [Actinokineospora sp.]|jgi:hypothetical protein|nr:hypothetical protein [Actinokineospora sp.]